MVGLYSSKRKTECGRGGGRVGSAEGRQDGPRRGAAEETPTGRSRDRGCGGVEEGTWGRERVASGSRLMGRVGVASGSRRGRVGVASGSRRGRVDARRSRSRSRPKQDVRLWPQGGATGLATVVKDVSKDKGNCDTNADASGI